MAIDSNSLSPSAPAGQPVQPSSSRAQQLQSLQMGLSALTPDQQRAGEQARQQQVTAALQQTRGFTPTTQQIGSAGAQIAEAAAKPVLAVGQQRQQTAAQLSGIGLAQQQQVGQAQAAGAKLALTEQQQEYASKLNGLESGLQNQLLDAQLDFSHQQAGRTLLNNKQLADWAVTNAKSDLDLKVRLQDMQQAYDRKLQIYQTVQARLQQAISQGVSATGQQLDHATAEALARQNAAIQTRIQQEKAKASNNQAMAQGVFTIGGAILGGIIAGPGGAAAGAGIGGAVGTLFSGTGGKL